ncbi:MAG TPA: Ig-like domain-containing protein [Thermoanaerobaculia bacterium]|nr:Ig-like domain-containing protein [Thermoanaerobaculia bacterium]
MRSAERLVFFFIACLALAVPAIAGDVGGNVYSNPGTITLRLEWGSSFENAKEIQKSGDGSYSFGVNIRNNTKYRVLGKSAPTGWLCRGKLIEEFLSSSGATQTHVYCGSSSSAGIRIGSWNLEWYDSADAIEKKRAIAEILNQYEFDVVIANEVLDAASWSEFIQNHLGNAADWDYRITASGCSLRQVTMWRKSAVTLESGYELACANSNCIIDENGSTWDDCAGRRPYVATFSVNGTTLQFTTATVHFKANTTTTDCQLRKDQVDSFVTWADWAGMSSRNFIVAGDFNDTLPGTGNCSSIDTLATMESHSGYRFATAQPDYFYSSMMGNGLVTYDTKSFQNTLDHFWVTNSVFDLLETTVDTYGNKANAVQANMYFSPWDEPDHNPPYIVLGSGGGGGGTGDTTAPTTSITSPADGATVMGITSVLASASDDVGVAKVEFYLDGVLKATDTSSPYEWNWDTTTVADGSHALNSKAYDAAGNVGTSSVVNVTVANSSQSESITLTASGYKVKGLQKADLSWSGATSTSIDVFRDGALIATTSNDGSYTDNINVTGGGSYVYQVCESGTSTCSNQTTVTF